MKYYDAKVRRVEYKKGGKLEGEIPRGEEGKRIKAVKARGGWTAMDYFIGV